MKTYISSGFVIICLILLQTVFIPFISLSGYLPDLLIIYLVYIALCRGQIEATIYGFMLGLLQDIIAVKFLGLAAFSKTVTGFIAGYFYNENTIQQTLGSYRFLLLIGMFSVIHNILYFSIFFQGSENAVIYSVFESTTATALYTIVISILPMFFFSRKFNIPWTQ